MAIPTEFIQIDEEGYVSSREIRVTDPTVGKEFLANLRLHQGGTYLSGLGETSVIVEAFDEPYVALQVSTDSNRWFIQLPYDLKLEFSLETLSLDEWDRFHGYAENKIPFVLSRPAQAEFFNLLDEYGDDFVEANEKVYDVKPYWNSAREVSQESFWTEIYKRTENPGWNLGEPAEALKDMLPRLKISRSRILVLGCGAGHDAALFASAGHRVTAVDISPAAIQKAKSLYGHMQNLEFIEGDLFKLVASHRESYDVVFEHTCYCAIDPMRRAELVKAWNQFLAPGGHLMGVFFAMEKRQGPPFGGTEWELRQRIIKNYQPIFWGRLRNSVPNRMGKEFFVYANKR